MLRLKLPVLKAEDEELAVPLRFPSISAVEYPLIPVSCDTIHLDMR
jgi:hypothetical protein